MDPRSPREAQLVLPGALELLVQLLPISLLGAPWMQTDPRQKAFFSEASPEEERSSTVSQPPAASAGNQELWETCHNPSGTNGGED